MEVLHHFAVPTIDRLPSPPSPKKNRCDVAGNAEHEYIPWNTTVKDFIVFQCFGGRSLGGSMAVDERGLFSLHIKTVAAVVRHMATKKYKYGKNMISFANLGGKSSDVSDTHI